MASIKQTKITIEKRRILLVRNAGSDFYENCPACGSLTEMLAAERAADFLNLTEREIFRLVEAGVLHFLETAGGRLFICAQSLTAFERETKE